MTISIIAALGNNMIIGNGDKLPWSMPADLKYFKKMTTEKSVIMGQRTFESIGKSLSGRKVIVLTRDAGFSCEECVPAFSIEDALMKVGQNDEVMVAGGASVYAQFLPLADRLCLTFIDGDFEGDIFFPEFNRAEWKEKSRIDNEPNEENPHKYSFVIFEKIIN